MSAGVPLLKKEKVTSRLHCLIMQGMCKAIGRSENEGLQKFNSNLLLKD